MQDSGVQTGGKRTRRKKKDNNDYRAQGDGWADWKQQGYGNVKEARVNMRPGQDKEPNEDEEKDNKKDHSNCRLKSERG